MSLAPDEPSSTLRLVPESDGTGVSTAVSALDSGMGERGVTERLEGVFERECVSSALAIDSLTIDAVFVAEAGPSSPLPLPPSPSASIPSALGAHGN